MKILHFVLPLFAATSAFAGAVPEKMAQAQIVFLGEIHDNPEHHENQADFVTALKPMAVVYEMLTEEVASGLSVADLATLESLEQATDWATSGWPDLSMYFPVFQAGPKAIYGAALPRDQARIAMKNGIADSFGPEAASYGLTSPLPEDQQAEREALQMAAHCDALPETLLPGMVDLQRLRDAMLARAALIALDETGGPVVVITGNGHARADWGAPSYVASVRPKVAVFSVAQTEDNAQQDPAFDLVLFAPPIDRPDPCAAFK
ncbi:MAG: ChaN family lipoprotein [Thalassovita sp.]